MKNIKSKLIILLGLSFILSACSAPVDSGETTEVVELEEESTEGVATPETGTAEGAGQGNKGGQSTVVIDWSLLPEATVIYDESSYSLETMLTLAIEDEYFARQEYEIILEAYGDVAPFNSIINAEVSHIQSLIPMFDTYDLSLPVDDALSKVSLPESLDTSYDACVLAEVNNIGMYTRFLEEDLPEDVRVLFESLKAASESHLESFMGAAQRE